LGVRLLPSRSVLRNVSLPRERHGFTADCPRHLAPWDARDRRSDWQRPPVPEADCIHGMGSRDGKLDWPHYPRHDRALRRAADPQRRRDAGMVGRGSVELADQRGGGVTGAPPYPSRFIHPSGNPSASTPAATRSSHATTCAGAVSVPLAQRSALRWLISSFSAKTRGVQPIVVRRGQRADRASPPRPPDRRQYPRASAPSRTLARPSRWAPAGDAVARRAHYP